MGKSRARVAALLCAFAFGLIAAGCGNNNQNSYFGIAWITLTDEPGDFTSYLVTVDSVLLTSPVNGTVTAVAVPELVDFTKLVNLSELWSGSGVEVGTYTSATITMDYTDAQISVQVNGAPVAAKVVDSTGAAVGQISLVVTLDPTNQFTIKETFAGTNAMRLAIDFDLAASNTVDLTTSPPTVTVKPFYTVSTSASDSKLIRIRGPLANSSVNVGTYSVFVRPFFDETNTFGSLSVFNSPSTVWTLDGHTFVGTPGLMVLTNSSAGATTTAAFCTFQPTLTNTPGITAGIFYSNYVVAGSTLEDYYTDGLEGDVIARNGNTLTLRGGTLWDNANQIVIYQNRDSLVLLGPATLVTADGVSTLPNLDYNSVSVGQHIIARGIYSAAADGTTMIDSTGSSSTNTGSVRLQSTQLWGSLVSSQSGSLLMNLQAIQDWPVGIYDFAGNGVTTPQDPNPASYFVNTGTLALPNSPGGANPVGPGDLLWIDGFTSPFGTAPPDFIADSISAEPTVPATMVVSWSGLGTAAPFATLNNGGLTIDLTNAAFSSGVIRIGADSIDMTTIAAGTPQIIPPVVPPPPAGLPPIFLPMFAVGNTIAGIRAYNTFADYVLQLNSVFGVPTPATKFTARGSYNPASNIFTASAISVVL